MKNWLAFVYLLLLSQQTLAVQNHLIIISGIGGEEEYRQLFSRLSSDLSTTAVGIGIQSENIVILSENAADGLVSTKHNIKNALIAIRAKAQTDDRVFIVLIGHGSSRGDRSVLNIPGPDISAGELAEALVIFESQALIIVNTASASGPFVKALASTNRVVITATANAREFHAPIFGEYFLSAFAKSDADTDKDEKISLLEAFDYARREVQRSYQNDKRILTEHALLDDSGDGVGSRDPVNDKQDGELARFIYLMQPKYAVAGEDKEFIGMVQRKQDIERSIGALKKQREGSDIDEYYKKLEMLLIDLALLTRKIQAQGG